MGWGRLIKPLSPGFRRQASGIPLSPLLVCLFQALGLALVKQLLSVSLGNQHDKLQNCYERYRYCNGGADALTNQAGCKALPLSEISHPPVFPAKAGIQTFWL